MVVEIKENSTNSTNHSEIPLLSDTKRSVPIKNLVTGSVLYDKLHLQCDKAMSCLPGRCLGSFMGQFPKPKKSIEGDELKKLAYDYLKQYHEENKLQSEFNGRMAKVIRDIDETGTYELTYDEISYGGKLGWRNAPRCPGRIQWRNLHLFDQRSITNTDEMFQAICEHIEFSTNGGNIKPALTVFPKRVKNRGDFRIWNKQLLTFACHRSSDDENELIGDKGSLEFSDFCRRLGWKGTGGRFDILPLVLSGPDGQPKWYEIPEDIIIRIKIRHPTIPAIENLDIEWFALPAVSGMMFEIGGIQFPAAPFSGWYSLPEVATRDLLDPQRYDLMKDVGEAMGLDMDSNASLWKDRVNTEINLAVLHSYIQDGVAIVDHFTQADQFLTHIETEYKLRGGCPSDWVWIVPPESGSLTPLFHQEMILYHLTPGYEYQDMLWQGYRFPDDGEKKSFKAVARSSLFTSSLYHKQLQKRPRAVILYGTETGMSLRFAKKLEKMFSQAFKVEFYCLSDFEVKEVKALKREPRDILLIVTSTFGSGDPPQHAEKFKDDILKELKVKQNSVSDHDQFAFKGLKYAVFALGSSAYPNFCAFGKFLNSSLHELGGEQVVKIGLGDDQSNQERSFTLWAKFTFYAACKKFKVVADNPETMGPEKFHWQVKKVASSHKKSLSQLHGKKVQEMFLIDRSWEGKSTILVSFDLSKINEIDLDYEPGDHLAVFPVNSEPSVDLIMEHLSEWPTDDDLVKLKGQDGVTSTVRNMLRYFVDITSTPLQDLLGQLVEYASSEEDKVFLKTLSEKESKYLEWKKNDLSLVDVFAQCPSLKVDSAFLIGNLGTLRPRWYSIASAPKLKGDRSVDLIVSVVDYYTPNGINRKGLCSNYLATVPLGTQVYCYLRKAPSFKLPKDPLRPIVMVASGSGIAPFKGFWEHRSQTSKMSNKNFLFFGCKNHEENLFNYDSASHNVKRFTAFSRIPGQEKMYVQDLVKKEAQLVYDLIVRKRGHIYVCGKVSMAEDIRSLLVDIFAEKGQMNKEFAEKLYKKLKDEGRYAEDIFGLSYSKTDPTAATDDLQQN